MVDLRPDHLAIVRAILHAEASTMEVWAFGSRARWTARDSSDLDIVLVTEKPLSLRRINKIRRAFEESYLPFKVDVVDLSRVSQEFRSIIAEQRVILQTPGGRVASDQLSDWQTLPLEECVETIIDYRGKTPRKVSSGIPLITAKIVKNGRIDRPQEFIAPEDYDTWMRRGIPRSGDVILTMEAPLGEVAQLDDRKIALAQRVVALRGKTGLLDNGFLRFLFQSDLVQDQLKSRATGTTVLGVRQSELRKINLILPPLEEQRGIARILSTLDDKIELNRRMNETLEGMARAIFKSWFVDFLPVRAKLALSSDEGAAGQQPPGLAPHIADLFPDEFVESELGEIPKGWEIKSLDEIADYLNGLACQKYPPEEGEESLPVVKIRELRQGITANTDHATINVPDEYIVEDGDVLFSWSGSLLIDIWTHGRVVLNQHLFKVTSNTYPKWFFYYWTDHHLSEFQRIAAYKATTMGHIKRHHLSDAKVCVPNNEVMQIADDQISPLFNRRIQSQLESRTLAALRDTLLPKLISGELRVPDAERFCIEVGL
jgi:type I restriction enzyme S subunit